jgi:hypothetical protein
MRDRDPQSEEDIEEMLGGNDENEWEGDDPQWENRHYSERGNHVQRSLHHSPQKERWYAKLMRSRGEE